MVGFLDMVYVWKEQVLALVDFFVFEWGSLHCSLHRYLSLARFLNQDQLWVCYLQAGFHSKSLCLMEVDVDGF